MTDCYHDWARTRDSRGVLRPMLRVPDFIEERESGWMVEAYCLRCGAVTRMDLWEFERVTRRG